MEELTKCQAHYIRCIKPNDFKKANSIDDQRMRHQVRYLGLLENVRVRRAGFSYRRPYFHFLWRYSFLTNETFLGGQNPKTDTEIILKSRKVDSDGYRLGHTKIFIRNPTTVIYEKINTGNFDNHFIFSIY